MMRQQLNYFRIKFWKQLKEKFFLLIIFDKMQKLFILIIYFLDTLGDVFKIFTRDVVYNCRRLPRRLLKTPVFHNVCEITLLRLDIADDRDSLLARTMHTPDRKRVCVYIYIYIYKF